MCCQNKNPLAPEYLVEAVVRAAPDDQVGGLQDDDVSSVHTAVSQAAIYNLDI